MRIADPLTLPCGQTLKNRLAKAAMTEGLADNLNRATVGHQHLYRRWAEGGSGMLLTGNVQVDRHHLERPGNVVIEGSQSPEKLAALKAWSAAGTVNGTQLWMQISHAGRQTPAIVNPSPSAPSDIPLKLPGKNFGRPRAMTEPEILDVVQRFAHAARIARETGFTGVQVHAAHGYLVSEFLSPLANQRSDDWGGSLENRSRLLREIVRAVRAAVGADFPVSVKLNSADFQKGGFSHEDCLAVVAMLDAERIDLLEISGGNYEQPKMGGLGGVLEAEEPQHVASSTVAREAYFLDYAASVATVAKMPLMVTGGFRSRQGMEDALGSGAAQVIGLGRPLCVLTEGPQQLLDGKIDTLPSYEKTLRLGPGWLSLQSPLALVKMVNAWGTQGWFCLQLLRMGAGNDPDLNMGVFSAFRGYASNEQKAAKALFRG